MLDTAVAAPRAGAAARKPKMAESGPKARERAGPGGVTGLITRAMSTPRERKVLSLAALKKAVASSGYGVGKNQSRTKLGPKSLVSNGTLAQTKGTRASGSFKLNKKPGETEEKATKEKTAAKPGKPVAKKVAGPAEKATKVVVVKKRPKKVKKPAATAAKNAAKSPKRATQEEEAAKSPAKTKAVKPTAVKKVAKSPKRATQEEEAAKSPAKTKAVKPTAAKKAATSPKTATQAGHPKETVKSPAKEKTVKPTAAKPKATKPKVAKAKKAVPKKK